MATILVVANQTLGCEELDAALEERLTGPDVQVHLVAPVTRTEGEQQWDYPPTDRYIPDAGQIAHALAAGRLESQLERLRARGVAVTGEVVDADPVGRVSELVQQTQAEAVVVCTLPERFSHWLRRDLPARLSHACAVPVQHVPGSAGPSL